MSFSNPPRPVRQAWLAGIAAELAQEFNLSPATVRTVLIVGAVLPAGLTYLALAWLAGRYRGTGLGGAMRSAAPLDSPLSRDLRLLHQRLAALEPRLNGMEAFVSGPDFELHKGFRQMGH